MRKATMIAAFGSLLCAAWAWQQPAPPRPRATSFKDIALGYAGRMCTVSGSPGGAWVLVQKKGAKHPTLRKLDMIGGDFLRFTNASGEIYVPFSAIIRLGIDR